MVFLGTELKLNIHIDSIDGQHMSDYDFKVEVFANTKKTITIEKSDNTKCKKVDNDNYLILLDTTEVGCGELICKITAYIPDNQFEDNLRTEVDVIKTGIIIKQS